ncbi:ABC-F family ATP-binding cassette domain-containing protein [Brochothrix campestris]|uniref:ABC-F family ATP-binding cassette domain-containing protein n=1 Tax=Brochothrix campestris TaxID=2757 RepID=UPI0004B3D754|nr:ABC-F family ATP-binding cassette domain-containing protein [Brochothrix campestris]
MKQITIEKLSQTYGERALFNDLSFVMNEGEISGLLGINGTGKSTLMKMVAGIDTPDAGKITHPRDYRIHYLQQQPSMDDNLTIIQQMFVGDSPELRALQQYQTAMDGLMLYPEDEKWQHAFEKASEAVESTNAWDTQTRAEMILNKLGIENIHQSISELSGGQLKRVGLAQVLLQPADLLLLDEPTNHLDYPSIQWLADTLKNYRGAVLMITHDRYFLDQTTNHIFELDKGKLYRYDGNYQVYLENKALREEQKRSEMNKANNLYRNELAWMRQGAKARSTKQKARIDRFSEIEKVVKNADEDVDLSISLQTSRLGKDVYELSNVGQTFDDKELFHDFSAIVQNGDRIGITGFNGSGKTTLLNMLASRLTPESGTLKVGQTVRVAYYTQHNEGLDDSKRIISFLEEIAQSVVNAEGERVSVSQLLETFLFPPSEHGKLIKSLSGGEKRRLYLLKLLMTQPNVLLLDEPTNDLDTTTLTVLENYLETFTGTVIAVSHDRYFLNKVAAKLWVFNEDRSVSPYLGTYSEWLEEYGTVKPENKKKMVTAGSKPKKTKQVDEPIKKSLTYKEQQEWDGIEAKIEQLDETVTDLRQQLEAVGADYTAAQQISEAIEAAEKESEQTLERWEYLSQYAQ